MHLIALILNAAALLAALAIATGAALLCSAMFRGTRSLQLAMSAIIGVVVVAPPAWTFLRAWHGSGGLLLWVIPILYLGLAIPSCQFLFGAASAARK